MGRGSLKSLNAEEEEEEEQGKRQLLRAGWLDGSKLVDSGWLVVKS